MPDTLTSRRLSDLNDQFRRTLRGGTVVLTAGITALGPVAQADILRAVAGFDQFSPDNDPYGEHDFGAVECDGQRCFWKIDAYDLTLAFQSPEATDPAVTRRVLTIMLADEY